MGQYESRPLGESDPVFEQGAKYGTNKVVFIEDLLEADDVRPQIEMQQASINLRFFEWADRTNDECSADYEHAMANLKKAAPNLREVCVCGCYAYKPDVEASKTEETIIAEMNLIRNRFQILVDACKKADIHLTSIRFSVYWIVQDEGLETIDFEHVGDQIFGPESTNPKADHVEWKFFLEETTSTMLCFHFVNNQEYLDIPVGRSYWTKTFPHDIA